MADATGAISYVGGTSRLWTRRGFLMGHRSKVAAEPVCEAVGVFHLSIRNWQSELQGDGDGPAPVGEHSRVVSPNGSHCAKLQHCTFLEGLGKNLLLGIFSFWRFQKSWLTASFTISKARNNRARLHVTSF
ncbi:PREDICTED: uncharacterized protein LOC102019690 isoform X3 [Chinchilla lanigera]|uniref:uncharacterized protein LOC102019690 isoform X3 n=1 Tax=Chinchilla lanigera TaxID=34839 RepID=UPI000697EB7A|nr:PREDICTED: uncharacterized protein LOC102019690 isoform X3 [Chinchilla lanigera]